MDKTNKSILGYSLVELMVTMVIGLLILLALSSVFVNATKTSSEMAKSNLLIENGRFAIQLIENDLIHGGYWGSYVPDFDNLTATNVPTSITHSPIPDSVPDVCLAYNATNWNTTYLNKLISIPVQVYSDMPATCAGLLTSKTNNTDVAVIRHANTCVAGATNCEADIAGNLYLQVSNCQPPRPDIPTPYPLETPYLLDTTNFNTLHRQDCTTTVTSKRKFISNIYYIRNFASTASDGIPTLVVSSFGLNGGVLGHQAATAMIEGIEGFHIELGIDSLSKTNAAVNYDQAVQWADSTNLTTATNRGDGKPDGAYVSCTTAVPCTEAQLRNVVAAKIYVLSRNLEPTAGYTDTKTYQLGSVTKGPFNDNYKRHVFSTTVRLNNVSARRETP